MNRALGELHTACQADGFTLRVLETDRSPARQITLYAQGRTTDGQVVTYARPYETAHNYGLAADVIPVPTTELNWKRLRDHARALGMGLIGEWDRGHLQHPAWPQILNLLRAKWREPK